MPDKSFSTFQVIFINGVSKRLIFFSIPNPDALPCASAFKKLPFSLDPSVYVVCFLTLLIFRVFISSSVNSKTLTSFEYEL